MARHDIPQELLDALDIDLDTGFAAWGQTINARAQKGREAGTITPTGYRKVCYRYKIYYLHRLVWAKAHGAANVPPHIDHRDGNPSNNALANLRPATQAQNNINVPARRTYSGRACSSRLKGVSRFECRGWVRWRARIRVEGKEHSLGYFESEEAASVAYREAERRFYGEFAGT